MTTKPQPHSDEPSIETPAAIAPEDAEQLFARCGEPRELWLVPGAGHRDVFEVGGDAYRQRVLDFLERSLPAS